MKLKQESSGYPQNVTSETERQEYIDNYFNHEGIPLDKDCIHKNLGLRSLSKLALNSFYGKFGQRTNMKKAMFVKDIKTLNQVLTDPGNVTRWIVITYLIHPMKSLVLSSFTVVVD